MKKTLRVFFFKMCDTCEELYSELELLKKRCGHLRELIASLKKESTEKDQKILNQRDELRRKDEKLDQQAEEILQLTLEKKNALMALKITQANYLAAERYINNIKDKDVMCFVQLPEDKAKEFAAARLAEKGKVK